MEALRITQELDHFLQFVLGLVDAGDVVEGHAPDLFGQHARLALAEAHGLAAARLHLAHEEDPHADEQQHGEPGYQDREKRAHLFRRRSLDTDAVLAQPVDQRRVLRREGAELPAVAELALDFIALDLDFRDLAVVDLIHEVGKCHGLLPAARRRSLEQVEQREEQQHDDKPKCGIAAEIQILIPFLRTPWPPAARRKSSAVF